MVQLSHPYMTTGKTIALTRWTFIGKVMSLLFNTLSRFARTFLPRSVFEFHSCSHCLQWYGVSHVGDQGSILGLGKSLGEGNGNPLQYSCLESPMDRGTWWAAVTLEPKKIKSSRCVRFFPSICREVMGPHAMILVFWMSSFKPTFSLSSFTPIKKLFSSSSLSAVRVVTSAYLRLLILLWAILIPACDSCPFLVLLSL